MSADKPGKCAFYSLQAVYIRYRARTEYSRNTLVHESVVFYILNVIARNSASAVRDLEPLYILHKDMQLRARGGLGLYPPQSLIFFLEKLLLGGLSFSYCPLYKNKDLNL